MHKAGHLLKTALGGFQKEKQALQRHPQLIWSIGLMPGYKGMRERIQLLAQPSPEWELPSKYNPKNALAPTDCN